MIFDMGMKLMMLLMMMIPLPEQHCHQPNVLPPKHTRSEMKQSVVSLKEVFEKESVFSLSSQRNSDESHVLMGEPFFTV